MGNVIIEILDLLYNLDEDVDVSYIVNNLNYTRKTIDKALFKLYDNDYILITRKIGKTFMWKNNIVKKHKNNSRFKKFYFNK